MATKNAQKKLVLAMLRKAALAEWRAFKNPSKANRAAVNKLCRAAFAAEAALPRGQRLGRVSLGSI